MSHDAQLTSLLRAAHKICKKVIQSGLKLKKEKIQWVNKFTDLGSLINRGNSRSKAIKGGSPLRVAVLKPLCHKVKQKSVLAS